MLSTLTTNLALLNFPPLLLTNPQKEFEAVWFFLFSELDPEEAKIRFQDCWPILDRVQGKTFRTAAFKWLEEIKMNQKWTFLIRKSLLDESQGDRFYRVL